MRRAALICALGAVAALAACGPGTKKGPVVENGDASRGHDLIVHYGCGACHSISGVSGADGTVGPPLKSIATRQTIAGKLANTPPNLVRWIIDPQKIVPGNDMPDLGVSRSEARDIAAYLYSQ